MNTSLKIWASKLEDGKKIWLPVKIKFGCPLSTVYCRFSYVSIWGKLDKYNKIEKLGTSLTDDSKTANSTPVLKVKMYNRRRVAVPRPVLQKSPKYIRLHRCGRDVALQGLICFLICLHTKLQPSLFKVVSHEELYPAYCILILALQITLQVVNLKYKMLKKIKVYFISQHFLMELSLPFACKWC